MLVIPCQHQNPSTTMHIQPNLSFSFPTLRIYILRVLLYTPSFSPISKLSRAHSKPTFINTHKAAESPNLFLLPHSKYRLCPLSILYFFSLNNKKRTHLMSGLKFEEFLGFNNFQLLCMEYSLSN